MRKISLLPTPYFLLLPGNDMNFNLSISFLYPVFLWLLLLVPLLLGLGWLGREAPDRRQRWVGLALRGLVLLGLILGLAGMQLERPVEAITTVFVLDVSDSVSAADRARAETFLRQALAGKPEEDQAAVVLFGEDALVERLPGSENSMPGLSSIPVENATNVENALRLALALLPNEGGGRIILLSDGQETVGEARRLADLAAARQVEVSALPLGLSPEDGTTQAEVLVEHVAAPAQARQGQSIPLEVTVTANQPTQATLRLLGGGTLLESRPVSLNRGRNQFSFNVPVEVTGFQRFRVELEAEQDNRPQNNWGAAFTTVFGPPRLLVIEGTPGEAAGLLPALTAAGLETTVIAPGGLPETLTGLAVYDGIILANVPADALSEPAQERLAAFVRDVGRGLVMLGGPESFGAGGYLRTPLEQALPVDMDVRNRSQEPNIALVLAVDKSGSMGACHCDNPDLRQRYTRVASGLPKVDIAKEAIFQASVVLGDLDYLGVVAFDSVAHWAVETAPRVDFSTMEQAVGGIAANGQTNIYAGLIAAEESLAETPARVKHVILLTDGWSRAGAYDEITTRFAEEGITLSIVAAGGGSAEYLQQLAEKGGGKYYPAASMSDVPQIFLKETIRAVGDYIIEEPFLPVPAVASAQAGPASPILRGIDLDSAPALLGYNGTQPKSAARVALLTPRGDPLLATWQYGLGRSAAWTSDLSGRWAQNWLAWPEFPDFVAQLVNWTLPVPGDEQMDLMLSVGGNEATIIASIQDQAGRPHSFLDVTTRLLTDQGQPLDVELVPTGPGLYRGTVSLPSEGVYLAQTTAYAAESNSDGEPIPVASQTTGLVMPYSAEYATLEPDVLLLEDLVTATAGQLLTDPAQAFAHTLALGYQTKSLWPYLLLLVALLFPFDVAVRRLRLGRREWVQSRRWVSAHLPGLRPAPAAPESAPPLLGHLFEARHRARQRQSSLTPPPVSPPAPPKPTPSSPGQSPPPAKPTQPASPAANPPTDDDQDTFARLRKAKKRGQR